MEKQQAAPALVTAPAPAGAPAPQKESLKQFFKRVPRQVQVFLVGLAVAGVSTIIFAFWASVSVLSLNRKAPLPDDVLARQHHPTGPAEPYTNVYEIKEISVHFASRETEQVGYAQFGLTLDLATPEGVRMMELNRARLLDLIFEVAADFSFEQMKTPEGYQQFKAALLAGFKKTFSENGPRDLAIKSWLIR